MTNIPELPPVPPVTAFGRRGHPILAWVVIVLAVAGVLLARWLVAAKGEGTRAAGNLVMDMQGRYLVGLHELLPGSSKDLDRQAAVLNTGPVEQRLRYVVLVGELDGAERALKQLDQLEEQWATTGIKPTSQQEKLLHILRRLYTDYAYHAMTAPSIDDPDRAWLREQLGWWGELALAPKGSADSAAREAVLTSAHRTALVLMAVALGILPLILVGTAGLLLLGIMLAKGKLQRHFDPGSAAGGVYAETFAIWIVLFMALSLTASRLPLGQFRLLAMGAIMLFSLAALAWPVFRGLSWRQVRREIGWFRGPRPTLEPLLGIGCYLMGIPLVAVGFVLTLLLIRLEAVLKAAGGHPLTPEDLPTHPIADAMVHLSVWGRIQVLFLASVIAPVVEETFFRGVLYRHLREATRRLAWPSSVLVSAIVVSFIFAVVHPQGLTAVPVLMALAFAFALAREWRGTLLPSIVAHGTNNGLVFLLIMLLL